MSIRFTSRVWELSKAKGPRLLLLLALADQANEYGIAWPDADTLAQRGRVEKRNVYPHLLKLEKDGELFIYRRAGLYNIYVITLGMGQDERNAAARALSDFLKTKVTGDELITGAKKITSDEIITSDKKITGKSAQPVMKSSPGSDEIITRNNTVVVVSESESPIDAQQQTGGESQRDPLPAELAEFEKHAIPPAVWRGWMTKPAESVLAAIVHVDDSPNVTNPIGLLRAMIEQGKSQPSKEAQEKARAVLTGGNLENGRRFVSGPYAEFISS